MNKKGLILVLSTALISGFSVFINKYGVSINNPDVFAFLKNSTVAILLICVIILFKDSLALRRLNIKQWILLSLIGVVGGGAAFLLFFRGLALTDAFQGALIHKSMFLWVIIPAAIFLKEKISKNFLLGGLLLFLGIIMILKSWPVSFGIGDALILIATLCWTAENVLAKYALREIPANLVAWGRMFFGSLSIFGYLAFSGHLSQLTKIDSSQAGWILITSVLLFGYTLTWYNGLKNLPVSAATAVLLLGLPITTLLTALAGSKISYQDIFSGAFIVCGLSFIFGAHYLWSRFKQIYVRT